MKCPNCAQATPEGAAECPACAIIFAKFLAQREKERREAQGLLERGAEKPARPLSPWVGRTVAGALVGLWLLGLYWYFIETLNDSAERARRERLARPPVQAPAPAPTGAPSL